MTLAKGMQILRSRYSLERSLLRTDGVSQTWLVVDDYGERLLARIWPFRDETPDELQRALFDSELRTLYRIGSSPGADENILVIKDAGLDRPNRSFVMLLEAQPPSTSGYEALNELLVTRVKYPWLSNRDGQARCDLWMGLSRIAAGLRLLHEQFILHRNVSAENVFLDSQIGPRSFRLGGFEWSVRLGVPGGRRPPQGWFLPPEFFEGREGHRPETDWFGFGMLAARCLVNLENYSPNEALLRYSRCVDEVAKQTRISELERSFLLRLIAKDPRERLTKPDDIRTVIQDIAAALRYGSDPIDDERPLVLVINPQNSELIEKAESLGYLPDPGKPLEPFNPRDPVHLSNLTNFIQEDLANAQVYAVPDVEYVVLAGGMFQLVIQAFEDPTNESAGRNWELAFCRGVGELRWNEGGTAQVALPARSVTVRVVRQVLKDPAIRSSARSWDRYLPSIDRSRKIRANLARFYEFIRCTNQLELLIRDAEIFGYQIVTPSPQSSSEESGERITIEEVPRARPVASFCRLDRGLTDFLLRETESNKRYSKLVLLTGPDEDSLGVRDVEQTDCWEIVGVDPEKRRVDLARPTGAGRHPAPPRGHIRTWGMKGQVALIRRRKDAIDRLESHSYLLRSLSAPGQVYMDTGAFALPVKQSLDVVDETKHAVMEDILRVRPIYALQGPPGTGKTTLVAHLVRQILADDPVAQILITAQAHTAVDVLREKVRDEAFRDIAEVDQPLAVRLGVDDERQEGSVEDVTGKILLRSRDHLTSLPDRTGLQNEWLTAVEEMLVALRTRISNRKVPVPDFCEVVRRGANLTYCTTSDRGLEALAEGTQSFDWSILEEAGKAHGFDLALPLQAGHRWLLIGDHKQLPPYRFEDYGKGIADLERAVESLEALPGRAAGLLDYDWIRSWWERSESDRNDFKEYLQTWLNTFDRVFALCSMATGEKTLTEDTANGSSAGMLVRQYRMHPTIGDLISEVYYGGKLQSMTVDSAGRPRPNVIHGFDQPPSARDRAILWVNVPWAKQKASCGERGPSSGHARYSNTAEAAALVWIVKELSRLEMPGINAEELELAVLAPYAQQVAYLNRNVSRLLKLPAGVTLKEDVRARSSDQQPKRRLAYTVDSFQGNQADIIAVTLVRNNNQPPELGLGFLDESARMNVLLSRAERLLILIGSWDFFQHQVSTINLNDEKNSLWHWKKAMVTLEKWNREGRIARIDAGSIELVEP